MPGQKFSIKPLVINAATPFKISRCTQTRVENVLLTIRENKITAYGEGAPSAFYGENAASVTKGLEHFRKNYSGALLPRTPAQIALWWKKYWPQINGNATRAAIDIGLWDYAAKASKQPLWKFCNSPGSQDITTSLKFWMQIQLQEKIP